MIEFFMGHQAETELKRRTGEWENGGGLNRTNLRFAPSPFHRFMSDTLMLCELPKSMEGKGRTRELGERIRS